MCTGSLLVIYKDDEGRWDGPATLKALREKYPPLTNEEAAGGPPATHPDNSALASCLDELVRLETKHKEADAFKLRAYKSAAMEIQGARSSHHQWQGVRQGWADEGQGRGQGFGGED